MSQPSLKWLDTNHAQWDVSRCCSALHISHPHPRLTTPVHLTASRCQHLWLSVLVNPLCTLGSGWLWGNGVSGSIPWPVETELVMVMEPGVKLPAPSLLQCSCSQDWSTSFLMSPQWDWDPGARSDNLLDTPCNAFLPFLDSLPSSSPNKWFELICFQGICFYVKSTKEVGHFTLDGYLVETQQRGTETSP